MASSDKLRAPLEVGANQAEFLEFSIDQVMPDGTVYRALYGINVFKVRHVIPMPAVTPFPMQTEHVDGVFQFRGATLVLINLPRYLHVNEAPVTDKMVIISEFNNVQVGFVVHGAHNIRRLSSDQLRPPPDTQKETLYKGINFFSLIDKTIMRVLDVEEIVASLGIGNSVLNAERLDSIIAETLPEHIKAAAPPPVSEPEPVPRKGGLAPGVPRDRPRAGRTVELPTAPFLARNVLVVDDSALVRNTLAKLLGAVGLTILVAKNGQEGWERINIIYAEARRQGRPIHELLPLAIVDIEMPQMDGFALTKLIKDAPELAKIKVLLHTSLGGPENIYKGYRVGADEFLVKFNPRLILEMTKKLLA